MLRLNLPPYDCKLSEDQTKIFDLIRKKFVECTREEWVRQHFINYLCKHLGYPSSLVKVEFTIQYNRLAKRPDIVVYDRSAEPIVLVECKAPEVKINEEVFRQAAIYNKIVNAPYLVVTNGMEHFCAFQDYVQNKSQFLKEIPGFASIVK